MIEIVGLGGIVENASFVGFKFFGCCYSAGNGAVVIDLVHHGCLS